MVHYHRKIRCPRHFVLKSGKDPRTGMPFRPWRMSINPLLRHLPEWAFKKWPILERYVAVKDRFGRKIRDDKSFYQPEMSAAFFIHQVYDPKNLICKFQCQGRCLEGFGVIDHSKNKRLQGSAGAK